MTTNSADNRTNKNAENWEAIYRQKKAGNYLMYPSEHLVTLFFQHKSIINLQGRCLDFGFGSANNAEFLIQQMSQLFGIDISDSSVACARERLKNYPNFSSINWSTKPLERDNFFDLVVAWQMLYYNDKAGLVATIDKLHRSMKSSGIFIATLITPNDVKVKLANRISIDEYEIDHRIPHQQGCRVYLPQNKEAFLALFTEFDVIDVGYYERSSYLVDNATSEYYVVARKR